jgi:hypothetical protein
VVPSVVLPNAVRWPDDVSDDIQAHERAIQEETLNLNSTGYPDHGRYGIFPCKGKFPRQNRESNPGPHG